MKVQSKEQLHAQIAALEIQNASLEAKALSERDAKWLAAMPNARCALNAELATRFGTQFVFVSFDHVDETGYWFHFSLESDKREQVYCVRHEEAVQKGRHMPFDPYAKKNREARKGADKAEKQHAAHTDAWKRMEAIEDMVIAGKLSAEDGAAQAFAIGEEYAATMKGLEE